MECFLTVAKFAGAGLLVIVLVCVIGLVLIGAQWVFGHWLSDAPAHFAALTSLFVIGGAIVGVIECIGNARAAS